MRCRLRPTTALTKILEDDDPEGPQALAIESVAAGLNVPVETVRQVYDEQLARLKSRAQITDFLAVLALRRTRELLGRFEHAV